MTKQTTETALPFFVYGSLLEGLYNFTSRLAGKVERIVPATLKGYKMYSVGAFPAIVPGSKTDVVKGEIMYIKPELYYHVMNSLDSLEGYNKHNPEYSMYIREKHNVKPQTGRSLPAYVYIWNGSVKRMDTVPDGNWRAYEERNTRYSYGSHRSRDYFDVEDEFNFVTSKPKSRSRHKRGD